MDEYFTVARAAAALDVSIETIRKRLQRGLMVGEHLTERLWVIPRAEVERWQGRGKLRRGRKPKSQPQDRPKETE